MARDPIREDQPMTRKQAKLVTTPERERLGMLIDVIAAAAKQQLAQPKNEEKGDDWKDLQWSYFFFRVGEEFGEMQQITDTGNRSGTAAEAMTHEAGDVLNFVAMYLDKFLAEVRKREDLARERIRREEEK